jgi:peptidoglycan hydrolase CwlO-like protein
LKETINQLQGDTEKLESEISGQEDLIKNQGRANYQSTETAGPEQ